MRVYTCDMCGKVMTSPDYTLDLHDYTSQYASCTEDMHYDLCKHCVEKFKNKLKYRGSEIQDYWKNN